MAARDKYECNICKLMYRMKGMVMRGGLFVCHKCSLKTDHVIPEKLYGAGFKGKTMKEVLDKVYEVKVYKVKGAVRLAHISLPQIMIGHKFKIVLAD